MVSVLGGTELYQLVPRENMQPVLSLAPLSHWQGLSHVQHYIHDSSRLGSDVLT